MADTPGDRPAVITVTDAGLVSVLIVTRDDAQHVEECLRALRRQEDVRLEVIGVDNASTDGTAERLEAGADRVIRSDRNLGYAGGMNAGIAATTGEFVLTMNADIFLEPRFITELLADLEVHPGAAGAGGKLLRPSVPGASAEIIDNAGGHILTPSYALRERGHGEVDTGQYNVPGDVLTIPGSAALFRRAALEDVRDSGGYFDQDFFAYKEDADICFRLRHRGWTLRYVPAAEARHLRGWGGDRTPGSRARVSPLARYHSFKNRHLFILKNARARELLPRLPLVLGHEIALLVYAILFERFLLSAYREVWRLAPRMLRRRVRPVPDRRTRSARPGSDGG